MRNIYLLTICALFLLCSCSSKEDIPTPPISKIEVKSNMEDRISQIIAKTNHIASIYESDDRAALLEQRVQNSENIQIIFTYIKELLNSGQTEKAILKIKSVMAKYSSLNILNDNSRVIHELLAICYLRKAEQENCVDNHTDQSCIVPIKGSGFHTKMEGSIAAIKKYKEILAIYPDDYQSKWLLNIAYMTLGKYPNEVPKKLLIPIKDYKSNNGWKNVGTFTGLDYNDLSGGVIIDDFDNNGFYDIITSSWGHHGKIKYYQNHGSKGFMDQSIPSQLSNVKGGLNLKQADFNNDGHMDFLILRGGWRSNDDWGILPNSLMMNKGDGTFTDVTISSQIYSTNPTQSAEWLDYDNDGWIDLFIANETTGSSRKSYPCELYHNNGDGSFTNVAHALGVNKIGYFKGVTSGDINNDGYSDLFLSNLNGDNVLLLNQGEGTNRTFKNIASIAGVTKPFAAFPCWFFDMNNDGWTDLFVSSFGRIAFENQSGDFAKSILGKKTVGESQRVYLNNKDNTFSDITNQSMTDFALPTMGCNYGDIDNDGFLDFYLGTGAPDYRAVVPNRLFKNKNGKQFVDHTFKMGVGHIQKGHGIAFCDFDNDGDQDIYAVMGGAFTGDIFPNALFENPGSKNNWIKINLEGKSSNKNAIGATIRVDVILKNGAKNSIYKTINSGASFGANPLHAHIGLGSIKEIVEVAINWPNAENKFLSYGPLNRNSSYNIIEGDKPSIIVTTEFDFIQSNKKHDHHHHH